MTTRPSVTSSAVTTVNQPPQGIGETIRQAVDEATREAVQQARQAQQQARQEVRDAQQEVRDAQQELRAAQQQLRDARTADQRGAAEQAVFGAQQQLRAAEIALRRMEAQGQSAPVIYTTQAPPMPQPRIPGEVVDISIGFFVTCAVIIVGWPISRALGRRFERDAAPPALQADVSHQLERIEQAVDAIAIEVERISESQRFLTKLQDRPVPAIE